MLRIRSIAVCCLLFFTLIANAEQISGRAEFTVFEDVPSAGMVVGDTGSITFGFESDNGSVVAGIEYRVKADFLEYDFGSVNQRFEGDIDLIISEDRGFSTDALIIDVNGPGAIGSTQMTVFGRSENFITTLDPTEVIFNWSANRLINIQSGDPNFGFTAELTWLSVPEPSSVSLASLSLLALGVLLRRKR